MTKFIPYGHQYIDSKDIREVIKTLKSDWLTQGPKVKEFEKAIANYCKKSFAVAFSSGTSALLAAYNVAGIKRGDEVITTPLTFAATVYNLMHLGAKPVFVDIGRDLNINPKEIEKKITKKTKAIVTVDFAGRPCDYESILKIAKKYSLLIIQDACHGLGANYKKMGDMVIFSFHPVKPITTGEGGIVVTNNKKFASKLRIFRNHGIIKKPKKGGWYYEIERPTGNYRMTDIQATLGISQLRKIDEFIEKRRKIAKIYNDSLKNLRDIVLPKKSEKSGWHIYPIQVSPQKRKKIFNNLMESGIGVQVHYMPVYMHPFYIKKFGSKKGDFPKSENYYYKAITLPIFPKMTNQEIKKVIKLIYENFGHCSS